MGFNKGKSKTGGRAKNVRNKKTLQWESIGEYIINEGSDKYKQYLEGLSEKEFADEYRAILEYFKPKQNRVDNVSSDGTMTPAPTTIITTLTEAELKKRANK